jgi:lysozyme family protein
MKDNFEECLVLLLESEGGYVDNKKDPGGRTNLGVTQKVWEDYVGHSVTEEDMRALKPDDVAPLYKKNYWDKISGDSLPVGVDYAVFDFAVNSGTSRAAKALQSVLGVTPIDGQIGPATLRALETANARDVASSVCDMRLAFMQSLPTYATFGRGWSRRVAEVEEVAFHMTA